MLKQPYMQKKSSFLLFYSFIVKFSQQYMGSNKEKLPKCDKIEWDEKIHYASDELFK